MTHIKNGVKTDNLVHIAHNVTVGENTILVAQVGISGSTTIGRHVVLAGQVGVAGHIHIGVVGLHLVFLLHHYRVTLQRRFNLGTGW